MGTVTPTDPIAQNGAVMARATFEGWLPEEKDSSVITRISAVSAVESLARRLPMNSTTKSFPRDGGMDVSEVAKGSAYGEDTSANDELTLTAKKFGKAIRIAEEDIDDSVANIIDVKKTAWGNSYARFIDNAALAVTAAIGAGVPFTSVYRAVTSADASTGYTANANHVSTATTGVVSYANLSNLLGLAEGSNSFDESGLVVMAHPSFKGQLRGVLDSQGNPIFVDGGSSASTPTTLFGYPVRWTSGARTSATATSTPGTTGGAKGAAGNPLMIVGQRDALMLGIRSGPESVVIDGKDGASALTDETILKVRARRAFGVSYPDAFAVLERVTA